MPTTLMPAPDPVQRARGLQEKHNGSGQGARGISAKAQSTHARTLQTLHGWLGCFAAMQGRHQLL